MKALAYGRFATAVFCLSLLVVLVAGWLPVGTAVGQPPTNATLRESISGLNVALADATTPMPTVAGKDMLFVDGSHFTMASDEAVEYVASQAKTGLPVAVFGSGFEQLCKTVGTNAGRVKYHYGSQVVDAPIAATAVKVLPRKTADGSPVFAQFQVAGDMSDPGSTVRLVVNWYREIASIEAPRTPAPGATEAATMGIGALVASEDDWPQVYYYSWSSADSWRPYGRLNINLDFRALQNDGSSSYNWRTLKIGQQTVPGCRVWPNEPESWRNSYIDTYKDVDGIWSWWKLIDYGPTTSQGQVQTGVEAGIDGAVVTSSLSWSYSTTDVRVADKSDFYTNVAAWGHNINETKSVGKYTYYCKPGLTYKTGPEYGGSEEQFFQAEYARPAMWPFPWMHWWSPVVEIDVQV